MGNSDSTLVGIDSNACQFRQIIKTVQGLPSNSKSPSDTWILLLKENVFYEHIPIHRAFIKMWPTQVTSDIKDLVGEGVRVNDQGLPIAADRLGYEREVYKRVIRPLMDLNVCTNFIRYLASGVDCSYHDLQAMLPPEYKPNLALNTLYMIQYHFTSPRYPPTRPSVTDEDRGVAHEFGEELAPEVVADLEQSRYGFIVNTILPKTTPLNMMLDTLDEQELLLVLFQMFAAIHAMELSLTNQNDMHMGNVMITNGDIQSYLYVIEGNMYTIRTKHFARIYDFDSAFANQLGPNQTFGNFKPGRDGFAVKHLFNQNRRRHALGTMLNLGLKSPRESIQEIWGLMGHDQPRPMEYVVDFVARYNPKTFVCSSTMFTPEGQLDTERAREERKYVMETVKQYLPVTP
jgi:hypothetical protein